MKKNLEEYVKLYENFLDQDFCKETIKELEKAHWSTHTFYQSRQETFKSFEDDLAVSWDQIPQRDIITEKIWFGIEQYIMKDFSDFSDWFCGWNGYSAIRFNRYDPSTLMRIHCDHIHSMFDGERKGIPALTILGGLNDDYEGGEFVMWTDTVIKIPAGSLLIFPSNFLYPHEVKPVKSGIRYSYVSWLGEKENK